MAAVRERKRKTVGGLVEMHLANFQASGSELVPGTGRFVGPKTIEVTLSESGTRVFHGDNIVISTLPTWGL
jgi:pyruvate/2-oxoglutarate dehydrogenase complex dihydrolipoamide dehydrogenase (E3) component